MTRIPAILQKYEDDLLGDWLSKQGAVAGPRGRTKPEAEVREQSRAFLNAFQEATQGGDMTNLSAAGWRPVFDFLTSLSS